MHREYHRWESPVLGMPMDLLWYGHWGRPVLMFPTSHGSVRQNEEFGLLGSVQDKIDGGEIQVCCIDTVDGHSWQDRGIPPLERVRRHDVYDRFLAQEVIPFVRGKAERDDVVAYGASFGAFHAVNFAFRHPEMISRVIAFSGVFDIHQFLDGQWSDLCYFHCPTAYVANWDAEWVGRASRIGIVLATGEHDHLVRNTREFAGLLATKGVPAVAEIWPGVFGHDWPFWRQHLRRFLP
jgi:esterase/lipase superfamily enzyme